MAFASDSTAAPAVQARLLPIAAPRPELPTPPLLDRRAIAADGWTRAREMAKTYGGTPRDHLAVGQRLAWSAAKRTPPDVAGSKLNAALQAIQARHDAAADVRRDLEALITTGEVEAAERQARDARTIHLRRQLEAAAEHGANLLAALSLPRLVGPDHIRVDPATAGDALDLAIATLDALDGDTDLEDGHDIEADHDLGFADDEPSLGAAENHPGLFHIDMDARYHVGRRGRPLGDQRDWSAGHDAEAVNEGGDDLDRGEMDEGDREPWLGAAEGAQHYRGGDLDLEQDGEIERPWWGPHAAGWNDDGAFA